MPPVIHQTGRGEAQISAICIKGIKGPFPEFPLSTFVFFSGSMGSADSRGSLGSWPRRTWTFPFWVHKRCSLSHYASSLEMWSHSDVPLLYSGTKHHSCWRWLRRTDCWAFPLPLQCHSKCICPRAREWVTASLGIFFRTLPMLPMQMRRPAHAAHACFPSQAARALVDVAEDSALSKRKPKT